MTDRIKSGLFLVLGYVLIGPPIGTLAIALLGMSLENPILHLIAILWMMPFSYFIGAGPAALTGLIVALLRPCVSAPPMRAVASAIAGGAVTAAWVAFDAEPPGLDEGVVNIAVIGAIAGLFCALVLCGRSKQKS